MDKHSKIIIAILLALVSLVSLVMMRQLDWQTQGYLGFGLSAAILGLAWALLHFESLILFILVLLPTIYNFNSVKVSLSLNQILPNYFSFNLSLNPIAVIYLLLILFFVFDLLDFRKNFSALPMKSVLMLSVIWATLSLIWSGIKAVSLIELIYFAIPFIFYFIAYNHFATPKKFLKLFLAIIISSLIPLIYSFWQLATDKLFFEADSSLGRLDSTMAHPNSYGLFLAIIIGLLVSYYLAKKNRALKFNIPLLVLFLGLLASLLLTYSRTAWICLALFGVIIAYREKIAGRLIVFSTPIIIIILFFADTIRLRLLDVFNQNVFNSVTARTSLWSVAWDKIIERPLSGYGVGTAEPVIEMAKQWQGGASLPHNDYLLQTLELGLIGLVFYCLYTFGALNRLIKAAKAFKDKFSEIQLFQQKSIINLHTLATGIMITYLSLLPATIFESSSQKILIQIILWSLLGSLLASQKNPA